MGYSNYYQVSSLRSGVTSYRDYSRQPHSVSRPSLPGVLRTWVDSTDAVCHIKQSGNIVKVLTAYVATGTTTNSTPLVLQVDGNNIVLTKNKTYSFTTRVLGILSSLNTGYAKEMKGVISIGANNASAIILAPTVDTVILDLGDGLTANATADTINGALSITVTGVVSESIRWIAKVEMLEL